MQIATTSTSGSQTASTTTNSGLEKAAQQFEAIFLRQMIGAMRSSSLGEGIMDSSATDQFRDLADARTADSMATKGSLGIAQLLLRQFGGTTGGDPTPTLPDGPAKDSGA